MRPDRRISRVLLALAAAAFLLSWAQGVVQRLGGADTAPATADGPTAELLAALPVTPETETASYDRNRFGSGWATGPDGCDTRTQVLIDESVVPATVEGCTVVAGEWHSLYDAARVTNPAELDIDHLVPLAEAWASGAYAWTDEQRQAFGNDLDPTRPDALVPVTAATNQAKADRDPAEWMPPDTAAHCRYVTAWITQKATWGLSVDPAEHQALADILARCPASGAQP